MVKTRGFRDEAIFKENLLNHDLILLIIHINRNGNGEPSRNHKNWSRTFQWYIWVQRQRNPIVNFTGNSFIY